MTVMFGQMEKSFFHTSSTKTKNLTKILELGSLGVCLERSIDIFFLYLSLSIYLQLGQWVRLSKSQQYAYFISHWIGWRGRKLELALKQIGMLALCYKKLLSVITRNASGKSSLRCAWCVLISMRPRPGTLK